MVLLKQQKMENQDLGVTELVSYLKGRREVERREGEMQDESKASLLKGYQNSPEHFKTFKNT